MRMQPWCRVRGADVNEDHRDLCGGRPEPVEPRHPMPSIESNQSIRFGWFVELDRDTQTPKRAQHQRLHLAPVKATVATAQGGDG